LVRTAATDTRATTIGHAAANNASPVSADSSSVQADENRRIAGISTEEAAARAAPPSLYTVASRPIVLGHDAESHHGRLSEVVSVEKDQARGEQTGRQAGRA
jgi:hypothetical protein